MTIDTGTRAANIQAQKQIIAICIFIFLILWYFAKAYRFLGPLNELSIWPFTIALIAAYILYTLYFPLRAISYFYISDTALPGMLRIRFFRIQPFDDRKMAYEIPLSEFHAYALNKKWNGLRHDLYITQKRGSATYTYDPISITLLRKHELENLKALLDQHAQTKATTNER